MKQATDSQDIPVEELLDKLSQTAPRSPQAAAQGRALFLAQARQLAPGVSQPKTVRHTGWKTHFSERILKSMKPRSLVSTLIAIVLLAVGGLLLARRTTTVSAQQVLDRAAQAQAGARPSQGIWHTRFESYNSPQALPGDRPGKTIRVDDYYDLSTGSMRIVTYDANGRIIDAYAFDDRYTYTYTLDETHPADGPLTIYRTPRDEQDKKPITPLDPAAQAKYLFDDFRSKPIVRLEGKITWQDGSPEGIPAYVLVADAYQTHKPINGQDGKTYTGSTKMIFNAQTYQLLESQISVRRNGADIIIDQVRYLKDEILPPASSPAWDLSDLPGAVFVDQPAEEPVANVTSRPISEHELAQKINAYVLNPLPEGWTLEIITAPGGQSDGNDSFEINYTNPTTDDTFGMQAVGVLGEAFVESNFYAGSYQAANGLMLYYSTSSQDPAGQEKAHTSAILTIPDGTSFLLFSSLPRAQVQALVETLVPAR